MLIPVRDGSLRGDSGYQQLRQWEEGELFSVGIGPLRHKNVYL